MITDALGNQVGRHDYLPYGEEVTDSSQNDEEMKYTLHQRDKNFSGTDDDLDYMLARYYSPHLGRFLSCDPVRGDAERLQTLNRYVYAWGNPVKYRDPDGRDPCSTVTVTGEDGDTLVSHEWCPSASDYPGGSGSGNWWCPSCDVSDYMDFGYPDPESHYLEQLLQEGISLGVLDLAHARPLEIIRPGTRGLMALECALTLGAAFPGGGKSEWVVASLQRGDQQKYVYFPGGESEVLPGHWQSGLAGYKGWDLLWAGHTHPSGKGAGDVDDASVADFWKQPFFSVGQSDGIGWFVPGDYDPTSNTSKPSSFAPWSYYGQQEATERTSQECAGAGLWR